MIINISNNPANPKIGNEWDTREFDVAGCELFENGAYKQIKIAGIITTKNWSGNITWIDKAIADSNQGTFDYNALRAQAMETCEFIDISNVTKAQACPLMTTSLVAAFDAQHLFDSNLHNKH